MHKITHNSQQHGVRDNRLHQSGLINGKRYKKGNHHSKAAIGAVLFIGAAFADASLRRQRAPHLIREVNIGSNRKQTQEIAGLIREAVYAGDLNNLRILLSTSGESFSDHWRVALKLATARGKDIIIQYLLDHPEVNMERLNNAGRDSRNMTLLEYRLNSAVVHNHPKIAKILLKYSEVKDTSDSIISAAEHGRVKLLDLLLRDRRISSFSEDKLKLIYSQAFIEASKSNQIKILKYFNKSPNFYRISDEAIKKAIVVAGSGIRSSFNWRHHSTHGYLPVVNQTKLVKDRKVVEELHLYFSKRHYMTQKSFVALNPEMLRGDEAVNTQLILAITGIAFIWIFYVTCKPVIICIKRRMF